MRVVLSELTSALAKVKSFVADSKTLRSVLLEFKETELWVCYADERRAVVDKITVHMDVDEQPIGKVIVDFDRLQAVVGNCQPSGSICVDDLVIHVGDGNRLIIECDKYLKVLTGNYIYDEEAGEEVPEVINKRGGHVRDEITYSGPDDNRRLAILTRMNYEDIFKSESVDKWEKDELLSVLAKLDREDGKTIYMSSKENAGFVINTKFVTYVSVSAIEEFSFSLKTRIAKNLREIFSKAKSDTLEVSVSEGRYCKVVTDDEKVGVWFEVAPMNRTDATALVNYKDKAYDQYRLVLNREMFENAVKNALSSSKNSMTELNFSIDEESDTEQDFIMNIVGDKDTSRATRYTVNVEDSRCAEGLSLDSLKLPMALDILYDILAICNGTYVMLDVTEDSAGKFIRVCDTDGRDEHGNPIVISVNYAVSARQNW